MRVLQVHNRYRQAGGEDTIVATEAELLRGRGLEVETHRVSNDVGGLATLTRLGAAPWNPLAARRVVAAAERFRADVVHVHNTWYSLSPAIFPALSEAGFPTAMTLHNFRLHCVNAQFFRDGKVCTDCLGNGPWRGVKHACYRGSRPQSAIAAATISVNRRRGSWEEIDQLVPSSPFVARLFADQGLTEERFTVHPNVLADPGGRSSPPSESGTLLFAGRLSPEKGLGLALSGWAEIAAQHPQLEIAVIGDGPERERLEAAGYPRVRFEGFIPPEQVLERMRGARALLFPSRWFESFPRTIVEAFALGLPVLANGIGAHGDAVGQLGEEWQVSGGECPRAWSEALARLADDELVEAGGRAARQLYRRDHSPEVGAERLIGIYRRAIARRAESSP